MNGAYVIIGLVALQRLIEVIYAERNTKALFARGAVEIGRAHYPLIVALHAAWLVAILVFLPHPTPIYWGALAVFVVLQGLRVWVLMTLGPYWTTRIITLAGAPLVRKGPYRFIRHPNYAVVACEIAVLPLVFGELGVAIVFSLANAIILFWRIRQEDAALQTRRSSTAPQA
ncbi:MAG TPA: isoprenylcysteine carboxylmethyltransferase family protein [Rhizomicrobium sp.]|nr:isoprenylcysteine carboxylmethyltransferase family protein [Rhizomicrobium sp.]